MSLIKQYINALRIPEVTMMTGFFIIGSFFGAERLNSEIIILIFLITVSSFLTILAVYAYNSASGKETDTNNVRLSYLHLISKKKFKLLGYVFLISALSIALFLDFRFAILSLIVFVIWSFYSRPVTGLKHKPYAGTILHFIAQIIHFNMCFLVLNDINVYSLSLSIIFALAFATGHLNHEIIDYNADKQSGIDTTAVKHGTRTSLQIIFLLILFNLILTTIIFCQKIINKKEFLLLIFPLICQVILYFAFNKKIEKYAVTIRNIYRIVFVLSILFLILFKLSVL